MKKARFHTAVSIVMGGEVRIAGINDILDISDEQAKILDRYIEIVDSQPEVPASRKKDKGEI